MLDGRNNRFFFPLEQMFFLMQIIFIVLPFNMAAVQNLYARIYKGILGYTRVYLTIILLEPEWAIDSEAMRARGIIVLVKSN